MWFSIENHFTLLQTTFYPAQKFIPEFNEPGRDQLIIMGALHRIGFVGCLGGSTVEKILRRKIARR
jgi:hypothetical protein